MSTWMILRSAARGTSGLGSDAGASVEARGSAREQDKGALMDKTDSTH
jgi:hypothetical protein